MEKILCLSKEPKSNSYPKFAAPTRTSEPYSRKNTYFTDIQLYKQFNHHNISGKSKAETVTQLP